MLKLFSIRRTRSFHSWLAFIVVVLVVIFSFWSLRQILYAAWTLASLLFTWDQGSSDFIISESADAFDITFESYSLRQTTAATGYEDRIPSVLHHIVLGHADTVTEKWDVARQSCLDLHPGWETHLWTDETADSFVAEKFPDLKQMWDGYPFQIQRVDALRHMVLYEYGGVVLDMDLGCRRALGPLRRFGFVAPEAYPVGMSVGFMMAERQNPFVESIIRNLKTYNHRWLGLPYPTVMFSTGCHFVSTIHTLQQNRTEYKVLRGPKSNPKLHQLNGAVSTPLFDHLGSSKWHSFDAWAIVTIGKLRRWALSLLSLSLVAVAMILYLAAKRTPRAVDGAEHRARARKHSGSDMEICSNDRTSIWIRL